jgi:outer membrane protein assembly factor BamD
MSRISQGGAVLLSLLLSACWSSSPSPESEAKELTTKDSTVTEDLPEVQLIQNSKRMYEAHMYSIARDNLENLKNRYPMGAYAAFAEIKLADSYFYNGEYNEAAKFYDAFLKNYPGSVDSPYVELQAARAHTASSRGTGRDREPLERALLLYDGIVANYPGSSYASSAERERVAVTEQLAEYDQLILEFYEKQENEAAVRVRRKQYAERWQSRLKALPNTPAESATPLKELPRISLPN